jgi:hypothetical protein
VRDSLTRATDTYRWFGFAVVAPIAAALLLVPMRAHIVTANVALVLMAVVVVTAVYGGGRAAAVAAVTSAIAFDFVFTVPYWRFRIDARDDIETTLLLLVVGLFVARVAATGWRSAREAETRSADIRRVYRLATLSARGDAAADVIMAAQQELSDLLRLRDCRFEAPPFDATFERLERSGLVSWPELQLGSGGFTLPRSGVELLVQGRGQLLGRFVMEPATGGGTSLDQRVVAVAVADQVGAALAAPPQGESRNTYG